MKILVVGDGRSAIHEVAVLSALTGLGHCVESFYWQEYFTSQSLVKRLFRKIQNKFLIGPAFNKLNSDFVKKALQFCPELIFIYRGTHITPNTIGELKRVLVKCNVFGYNNDDPFAVGHPPWLWRHFMKSVPIYDLVFAYRKHNISEYINIGANRVELLMPWFIPEKDKPKIQAENINNKFDVVFVGHYELDERIDYLRRVAESNLNFGLFGPDWDRAPQYAWLQEMQPVLPLVGNQYRETLISAKIALCFLSKLNRDTYTRRCFEIPAMGVFMLCQYSEDLANLFEDGVDVVFFRDLQDMIEKMNYYLSNDKLREQIAFNGMCRVNRDNHDIVSRMKYVLNYVTNRV